MWKADVESTMKMSERKQGPNPGFSIQWTSAFGILLTARLSTSSGLADGIRGVKLVFATFVVEVEVSLLIVRVPSHGRWR